MLKKFCYFICYNRINHFSKKKLKLCYISTGINLFFHKINSSFYKDFFPFILLSILAISNLGLLIFVFSFYVHLCIFHQTAKIYSALFNDTYSNNFYLLIDCQVDLYWLIPRYTKKRSV